MFQNILIYASTLFLFPIFAVQDALKTSFTRILEVNINTCHPYFVNKVYRIKER